MSLPMAVMPMLALELWTKPEVSGCVSMMDSHVQTAVWSMHAQVVVLNDSRLETTLHIPV